MAKTIRTIAPGKGDLVPGHKVYMFFKGDLPCVRAKVVSADASGKSVEVEVVNFLAVLGLPKRSRWTWRRSVNAYQHEHSRTSKGEGLALVVSK